MGSCYSRPTPTWDNTTPYVPKVTKGLVIKVYDGDTITIATKIPGDSTTYRFQVRLRGIDCPEMKDQQQKEIALIAQKTMSDHILGKKIYLHNVALDKYGRLLADVEYNKKNVTTLLLDAKLAIYYDGGKKENINWKKYYESRILDI